jgi:hypothetical protein
MLAYIDTEDFTFGNIHRYLITSTILHFGSKNTAVLNKCFQTRSLLYHIEFISLFLFFFSDWLLLSLRFASGGSLVGRSGLWFGEFQVVQLLISENAFVPISTESTDKIIS